MGVQEWRAELLEPRSESREDFTKFVSSLALSVHVEAALSHVIDPTSVAVQVGDIKRPFWMGHMTLNVWMGHMTLSVWPCGFSMKALNVHVIV